MGEEQQTRNKHHEQEPGYRILNISLLKNPLSNSDFNIPGVLNNPVFFSPYFQLESNPNLYSIVFVIVVLCRIFQLILCFILYFLVLLESKTKTKQKPQITQCAIELILLAKKNSLLLQGDAC